MLMILLPLVASLAAFGALLALADRKRGTVVAQGVLIAGAVVFFAAIVGGPDGPGAQRALATLAVGLLSAGAAGMLYHLYLGRFASLATARAVFVAVYLGLGAIFALVFLSLI